MAALLILFAAGAAAAGLHAVGGLMLTPFFGASPFFWSIVVASFPLSMSLGLAAGQVASRYGKKDWPRAHFGAAAASGLLVLAVPIFLAPLTRAILDRNPDALYAPILVTFVLITLPSAVGGAALARILGTRSGRETTNAVLFLSLGGTAGIAVCAPVLLDPASLEPWAAIWMLGAILVVGGVLRLGPVFRILVLVAAAGIIGVFFARPNEVRSLSYRKALEQSWRLRVGEYYLDTAGQRVLDKTEIARRYEEVRSRIAKAGSRPAVAVLLIETLRGMGPVTITGAGLKQILDLYLPDSAKPKVLPFLSRVDSIRSDGKGKVSFSMRWEEDRAAITIEIPADSGDATHLVLQNDFNLTLHVSTVEDTTRTTIDVGPVEVEKAGFFGKHDTYRTPVLIEDAKLFVDAHLLGLSVDSSPRRVVVSARAQAAIGAIQESVLQTIEHEPR